MKNNYDDKEMAIIFYDLYYICMKYNNEKKLSIKEKKKEKKEIDCEMYFNGYKFFIEKYINNTNRMI